MSNMNRIKTALSRLTLLGALSFALSTGILYLAIHSAMSGRWGVTALWSVLWLAWAAIDMIDADVEIAVTVRRGQTGA